MNSDDELAQRGRAIFERLREASTDGEGDPAGGTSLPSTETVAEGSTPIDTAANDAGAGVIDAPTEDAGATADAEAEMVEGTSDDGADSDLGAEPSSGEGAPPPDTEADTTPPGPGQAAVPAVDAEDATSPGEDELSTGGDGHAEPPATAGAAEDAPTPGDGAADPQATDGGSPEAPATAVTGITDSVVPGAATDSPGGAGSPTEAPAAVVGEADAVIATADPPVVEDGEVPHLVASQPASFARPLPRILAIANQKGGVGKTTTAVNLSAALAELGYRVLVIDLDPQGNATTGLGVNPRNLEASVYDVLMHDVPLEDCIEPTSLRNLFVVPATIDLAGAEIELVPSFSRELKLRKALEGVIDDFDFVLIDCPPSLGLITVNGLAAATEVVVPIQCEYYALEGLGQLLRNVNLVQGNLNPKLEVSAIILTMYDARTKLADQVANEVRTHFGTKVCRNIVPRTVRLSEAPSFGQPIIVFDPSSRGAIAYRELAKEVSGGAPQRVG